MNGAQKLGFRTLGVQRRRVISAWRGFCLIHAGLEAGIQGLVNLSALLVSDAPEAEEQGWDGQNEVLQVEEHGVNRGGAGGDWNNTIVLRPFDESQSSSDGSRWKRL